MRNSIVITIFTGLLFGCTTPAEQNAALERDVDSVIQAQGPVCQKQGYAADSAQWRNCVYQLGKQEFTSSSGSEWHFPLIHRLGQKLGLIRGGERHS